MTKNNIIPFLIFISFIIGFVLGEDTLGGGKHDYLYHEKYFLKFFQDFKETFHNFGTDLVNENVRNSPVFYIIFSQFLKIGISIENLKFVNGYNKQEVHHKTFSISIFGMILLF